MSIDRQNPGEHTAFWRRVLNKPDPVTAERKPTQAERLAAWSAQNRQNEAKGTQTRAIVATPGVAYKVGAERFAMDGTRWKRVA